MKYFRILFILSLIGLCLSLFLTYQYSKPEPVVCIGEHNACDGVRLSPYSNIFGIRLPILGDIFFFGLSIYIGLTFFVNELAKKRLYKTTLLFSLLGALLFELYLTYLQLFVINSVCFWCVFIGITVFGLGSIYLLSLNSDYLQEAKPEV